jgi:hypothetical protein
VQSSCGVCYRRIGLLFNLEETVLARRAIL